MANIDGMSLLVDAEYAYKRQRAEALLMGKRQLRTAYRRAHARGQDGNQLALVRLRALTDEFISRGLEPPRV